MSYYTMDIPYFLNYYPRQINNMPFNGGMVPQQMPAAPGGMPLLPSGIPTGPAQAPMTDMPGFTPATTMPGEELQPAPETVQSTQYVPGYLKTQIGKTVRVEFLVGTNGPLVDRMGTLVGVGASYILLRPIETDDVLLCDLYSIKFVTFMY